MKDRDLLDQVCDPMTSEVARVRLRSILDVLAGVPAGEARDVLRLAGIAVDYLPIMPTLNS